MQSYEALKNIELNNETQSLTLPDKNFDGRKTNRSETQSIISSTARSTGFIESEELIDQREETRRRSVVLSRVKFWGSFESNEDYQVKWLENCFNKVFIENAADLRLRGHIQFQDRSGFNYVRVLMEGTQENVSKMMSIIVRFQEGNPLNNFNLHDFTQAQTIEYYSYPPIIYSRFAVLEKFRSDSQATGSTLGLFKSIN